MMTRCCRSGRVDAEKSPERTPNPAATDMVLGAGGLGVVEFGAKPNDVIDRLTQEFGPSDEDGGYTPAFSVFGTCPGEEAALLSSADPRALAADYQPAPRDLSAVLPPLAGSTYSEWGPCPRVWFSDDRH